ncbi:MAG: UDP-3-O-acyl-N-acetylglucosamine deacetylase [bacterium]
MRRQQTIRDEILWEGIGIHTGVPVSMRLLPSPEDTGVVFLHHGRTIPAALRNLSSATRSTNLSSESITIYTIEHILAALYAMEIDNAVIELSAPEPPVMDGSALPFAEGIRETGTLQQGKDIKIIPLPHSIESASGEIKITARPCEGFKISYFMDYPDAPFMKQEFHVELTPEIFLKEIAPARTFATASEVKGIIEAGLARGGSYENAVVIEENATSSPLRFPEEPARHKVLDIIGDFALLQGRLQAHITAVRTGHAQNHALLREIAEKIY